MKYSAGDRVYVSYIKKNILRFTITGNANVKNDSRLIQKEVYSRLHDREQKSVSVCFEGK
jgi:hypothetical protein